MYDITLKGRGSMAAARGVATKSREMNSFLNVIIWISPN